MSDYTQMDQFERAELLSLVGSIAHNSNEFLEELKQLIEQYKDKTTAKIGIEQVRN